MSEKRRAPGWFAQRVDDFKRYPPTRTDTIYAACMVVFWLWYWRCT